MLNVLCGKTTTTKKRNFFLCTFRTLGTLGSDDGYIFRTRHSWTNQRTTTWNAMKFLKRFSFISPRCFSAWSYFVSVLVSIHLGNALRSVRFYAHRSLARTYSFLNQINDKFSGSLCQFIGRFSKSPFHFRSDDIFSGCRSLWHPNEFYIWFRSFSTARPTK